MKKWEKTACAMCSQSCGLEMEIENNRIINVRPDPDNPHTKNYCCRKGRAAKYFQHNVDRLNYPLKRVGKEFVRISWEQAFKEIAEKQKEIMQKHGPRATAVVGEFLAASHGGGAMAAAFRKLVGTQYNYTPVGVEFMGMLWSHGKILGGNYWLEPDEDRTEVLVLWGSNSYVSHQMVNSRKTIRYFSEDPNHLVITVDPRVSETARMSDMHVALRPGTDALLMRAMIALILKEGWQNQAYLDRWVSDFDRVRHWYEDFDIEGACRVAGVPYEQIKGLCKILTTRKWGVHPDLGLFMGRHNTLSSFLLATLGCVCGMLLVPGGNVIYPGFLKTGRAPDENNPKVWRTIATNRFPIVGSYPAGVLPEEIMSDNPDRLRSVLFSMTNPARSYPDSKAQEEAYSRLDLMVAMDICRTETGSHAHYLLPCKSAYEMYDFSIFQYKYHETFCQLRHPVVESEGERKETSEIWLGIIDAMGFIPPIPDSLYEVAHNKTRLEFMAELIGFIKANPTYEPLISVIVATTLGKAMGSVNKAMLWLTLMNASEGFKKAVGRAGFKPGPAMMDDVFQALIDHPEGVVIGLIDLNDIEDNFKYITHQDHKIHLYHEVMDEYIKNVTPEKEAESLDPTKEFPLIMSAGRHADAGHNGVMRNPETYHFRNPGTLALNPEDGEELGIKDGQRVRVTTEAGSAEIEAELTYQTQKGYVLISHHFGFNFNGKTYGIGVNSLTSARHLESVTGNPIWRYVPCRVEAISG